jgi:hypothetical protein
MNFKNILIFCFFLYTAPVALTQNEENEEIMDSLSFKERLVYNIGGGVTFGTFTNIQVQPQVGYRITRRLTSGIGVDFQYYRDNRFTSNNEFLVYGGNVFTRFSITPQIYTQAEYQALTYSSTLGHYVLLGGGFTPGGNFFLSAYYLLVYPRNNNIYGMPYLVRIGFTF